MRNVSSRACSTPPFYPAPRGERAQEPATPTTCYLLVLWPRLRRERFGEERRRGEERRGAPAPRRHGPLGRPRPLRPELHERGVPPQGRDPRPRRALEHLEAQEPRGAAPL